MCGVLHGVDAPAAKQRFKLLRKAGSHPQVRGVQPDRSVSAGESSIAGVISAHGCPHADDFFLGVCTGLGRLCASISVGVSFSTVEV